MLIRASVEAFSLISLLSEMMTAINRFTKQIVPKNISTTENMINDSVRVILLLFVSNLKAQLKRSFQFYHHQIHHKVHQR